MELNKPETDPLKIMKDNNQSNVHNRNKNFRDPGTVQDYESRRMLQRAKNGLKRNKKWLYFSFFLEFVVFATILVAFVTLIQT